MALDHYNVVAATLMPPQPPLKWDKVVEYVFLSDFDLLCKAHQKIQSCPWGILPWIVISNSFMPMRKLTTSMLRSAGLQHTFVIKTTTFASAKKKQDPQTLLLHIKFTPTTYFEAASRHTMNSA